MLRLLPLLSLSALALAGPLCPGALAAAEAPLALSVAYFGETLTHPGLSLGVERSLWAAPGHSVFLAGQLGGYTHPRNHSGLFLAAELGYRLSFAGGLSTELSLGAGGLHTRLAGDVYVPSGDTYAPTADAGRFAFMPTCGLGLGYTLPPSRLGPERVFAKLQGFGEYPVNTYMLPHLALQLGLQWPWGNRP